MNEFPNLAELLLRSVIVQAPVLLVWLAGAVIALVRWPRHPAVSLLTLIASCMSIAVSVLAAVVYAWVPHLLRGTSWLHQHPDRVFDVVYFLLCNLHAVVWTMILIAMFRWRDAPTSAPR